MKNDSKQLYFLQDFRENPHILQQLSGHDTDVVRAGFLRLSGGEAVVGTVQTAALARHPRPFPERGHSRRGKYVFFYILTLRAYKITYRIMIDVVPTKKENELLRRQLNFDETTPQFFLLLYNTISIGWKNNNRFVLVTVIRTFDMHKKQCVILAMQPFC